MDERRTIWPDRTAVDVALLCVRVIVGVIMAAHGAQKLFGAFGGKGLAATVADMGTPLGHLVAIGECLGGVGIIVGFLTRFSAAANIVIMLGAIAQVHGANGFFMKDGGFEYNLALIGLLIPPLLLGPGRFSIGHLLPLPKHKETQRTIIVLE